ncbi:MAG: DUF2330 domain-containing protein [Archangium sp.]|nr:DUF2330 domain-containing protein [Archangium sp.]
MMLRTLLLLLVCAPFSAEAFCGFYVSGAGAKLFNDASMVVLLRDGTRTVLSMQNNYRGPAEDFALVVPVPVVLQKDNVKTLPREAFTRLDELTSPRLVEMTTEQCLGLGGIGRGGGGHGSGMGSLGVPRDLGVKVEAKFNVEEYEIVILSAEFSLGLEIWLKENKYKIPDGAAALLKPYVQAGSKFFVAKVDAKKAKHQDGALVLSPLRFSYDTETFSLPVRLGLLNSGGQQELIVHIIAKDRYELANAKNVLVPTNFDVRTRTQPQFGAFYADLLDRTFKKNPGAAVTEFAWEGALPPPTELQQDGIYGVTCDPCPPPHPVDNPLAKYLGVLSLPKIKTDHGIAAFARGSTVTRLHLRYTKDSPPDDLVFRIAPPIAGGIPEMKEPGPAKANRFQGRYVMWVQGCGGGLGGGFFSSGSPLSRPQADVTKLVDPIEELIIADLPALDLKARPLRKDAPPLKVNLDAQPVTQPVPFVRPVSMVQDLAPTVTGPLDKDLVRRIVKRNLGQLRFCYELELNRTPGLMGKLTVELIITPEGTVAATKLGSSNLGNPNVENCFVARAKTWSFPKSSGTVTVLYPFVVKPPGQ